MQIIEKSSFGIRSSVCHLKKDNCDLEFIVFPMVHIGANEYYERVFHLLTDCDLIIAEGVKSQKASFLTLTYRIVDKIKRLNLANQEEALTMEDMQCQVVIADIDECDFDKGWSDLPFGFRLMVFLLVPFYVLYISLFGTRRYLMRRMNVEDLTSREELLDSNDQFNDLVLSTRDKVIVSKIDEVFKDNISFKKKIGIVYGAKHMRAIYNHLLNVLGFNIIRAEWVNVI